VGEWPATWGGDLLRREGEGNQSTSRHLARAARSVPRDHVLPRMKEAVDWAEVARALMACCHRRQGWPRWPKAVMGRVLLREQYTVPSDRERRKQVASNLPYCSYAGFGWRKLCRMVRRW
jgi:hypothetical protein